MFSKKHHTPQPRVTAREVEFVHDEDIKNERRLGEFIRVSERAEQAVLREARRIRAHRHWAITKHEHLANLERAERRARVTAIVTGRIPRDPW